ncbi:hypothetical protein HanRHA438_Chr08g0364651 [Helianthus annuus]|nr:hypothetical protein HanIR_Chr08g0380161 [Helianthus annuus]KAJ0899115.1 hypothetical protein HanRHA438_Chr08g0364651 [Helianthus annuus]
MASSGLVMVILFAMIAGSALSQSPTASPTGSPTASPTLPPPSPVVSLPTTAPTSNIVYGTLTNIV